MLFMLRNDCRSKNDISITEEGITAADLDADGYVTAMDQNKLLELIAHADF